jgi:predicted kinase
MTSYQIGITFLLEEWSNLKSKLRNSLIKEGVDDPGILKCVFMAGGPGSGKSFVANEIFGVDEIRKGFSASFSSTGLKVVNSDSAFTKGLKDNGIDPRDLAKIEKEEPELWNKLTVGDTSVREKAKKLTQKQKSFYEAGRLGMIIDGTGDDYDKIKKQKKQAEELGYDCYMVFVNTTLEVALERNKKRERVLSELLVTQSWKECQQNLGKFQSLFGSNNFRVIDNSEHKPIVPKALKAANEFMRRPIYNPIGKKWIQTARALKNKNLIK